MVGYLGKLLFVIIFSFVVIFTYYKTFSFHQESFNGYMGYIIPIFILYTLYKSVSFIQGAKQIVFTPIKLVGYFFVQLFLLCILFFTLNGNPGAFGFTLFFKILGFLILPTFFVLLSISIGKKILQYIKDFSLESRTFQLLASLGIGFFLFNTFLTLCAFAGWYNIYAVFTISIVGLIFSYKDFFSLLQGLYQHKIILDNHNNSEKSGFFSKINPYLLSSEFLFIFISFLVSINFINIVRPMPIGWDDLGAYMNFPNLIAASGEMLGLGMISWQTFTGIGYMFDSATQSFFLNNVGGVLSLLVIILAIGDLLKSRIKTFIHIPLLTGAIFLSMPMVIFQQAKDMKLDPGLFFVSAITIYITYYLFEKYLGHTDSYETRGFEIISEKGPKEETLAITSYGKIGNIFTYFSQKYQHIGENDIFKNRSYLIYILIIGILAGYAFTIKITSLLLISGLLGVIFYAKIGISGFLGYLSLYIAIFTYFKLWSMMFVVVPDEAQFRNVVSGITASMGAVLFLYSFYKYSLVAFKKCIVLSGLFLLGVGIGFGPWAVRNTISLDGNITIGGILNGKSENFSIDYTKIYSQDEIDAINKKYDNALSFSASGTTTNEDMGRYFGYEQGINNYIKLPFNLTMQSNQRGEFTDITFIYFAFIPALLLFLAFKGPILTFGYFIISAFTFLFFFQTHIHTFFTEIFSKQTLPGGYIVLAGFFLIPFFYLMYTLDKSKNSQLFKLNLVFGMFYIFLWSVSAFGIVWYGIAMYFSLLFGISLAIHGLSGYTDDESEKNKITKLFGSLIVFGVVCVYFFNSSYPHGFNNIKSSGYQSFKAGQVDNYTAIFDAHQDYYTALLELNLDKNKKSQIFSTIAGNIKNEKIKQSIQENNIKDLHSLNLLLKEYSQISIPSDAPVDQRNIIMQIKAEVNEIRSELYKKVLYPGKEYKNTAGIYRIGTFLKYFITDNHNRLFEDSLVFEFSKYFYNKENIDESVEKMKKIGVDYFLVDLNAATIDRDPRRNLTQRFEQLLHTFTSDKLELIQSDSMCLKIALDDYKSSQKTPQDLEKYMRFAGVNYESYTQNGETINRGIKQLECYNYILELIQENKITDVNYSYLLPIQDYIKRNPPKSQEELFNFFRSYVTHGWMVLFRIK